MPTFEDCQLETFQNRSTGTKRSVRQVENGGRSWLWRAAVDRAVDAHIELCERPVRYAWLIWSDDWLSRGTQNRSLSVITRTERRRRTSRCRRPPSDAPTSAIMPSVSAVKMAHWLPPLCLRARKRELPFVMRREPASRPVLDLCLASNHVAIIWPRIIRRRPSSGCSVRRRRRRGLSNARFACDEKNELLLSYQCVTDTDHWNRIILPASRKNHEHTAVDHFFSFFYHVINGAL